MWEDVAVGEGEWGGERIKSISVHVKSPKVDRIGAGDEIQVFELGNFMCPVAAFEKYRQESKVKEEPKVPVFRLESGQCMTGAKVNEWMAVLIGDIEKLVPGGVITSHSFRSGVPSEMAREGRDEEAIQAVGRWKSDAYKAYVKLPLARRAEMARSVGRK
jgi:hypothetical protein